MFLATHKAVYERLHSETNAGGAGGLARQGLASELSSFADVTAEKFGMTTRKVQKFVAAGSKLGPDEIAQLRQAPRQVILKDLQGIAQIKVAPDRYLVAKALAAGEATNAAGALKALKDPVETAPKDPVEEQRKALNAAWARAGAVARRRAGQADGAGSGGRHAETGESGMIRIAPDQEWWTAQEMADAAQVDLPDSRQGVDAHAKRLNWRAHPEFSRKPAGKGGDWQYSWRLFPARAQRALLKQANAPEPQPEKPGRDEVWQWFDGRPDHVKAKAKASLRILQEVEALTPAVGRYVATCMIAKQHKISDRQIRRWFEQVNGVDPADRLPYLAPRHSVSASQSTKAADAIEFCNIFKGPYMRPEGPDFTPAWRDAKRLCHAKGHPYLEERTARRWYKATVKRIDDIFARKGVEALRALFPAQIRDRSAMMAMEMVNADFHKVDVFVWRPGIKHPVRVQLIAFQDV